MLCPPLELLRERSYPPRRREAAAAVLNWNGLRAPAIPRLRSCSTAEL